MHGVCLSFLKQISFATNSFVLSMILTLHYFYVQASNIFDSLEKPIHVRKHLHTCIIGDAMFSKTAQRCSEATHAQCLVLFHLYKCIMVQEKTNCLLSS